MRCIINHHCHDALDVECEHSIIKHQRGTDHRLYSELSGIADAGSCQCDILLAQLTTFASKVGSIGHLNLEAPAVTLSSLHSVKKER